ncbi:hypothetical protein D9M68_978420 [compost metagenome]
MDEAVETQGQSRSAGSSRDEEAESGLFFPACQRDVADLPGVLSGGDQGDRHAMVC